MTDTAASPTPPPFSSIDAARAVLRSAGTAALATLSADGHPFSSFVSVATDVDGTPLLLISRLALHTGNLDRDPRCSLLLVAPGGEGGDPLAGNRLSVTATAARVALDDPALDRIRRRYLARHPEAAGYAGFADFGFVRLDMASAHLVAGFGRIHTVAGGDLVVDPDTAAAFAAAEADVIDHMNADHGETTGLYATALLGQAPGPWQVVAADPDGLDLACDGTVVRLPFPRRHGQVGALRLALKQLADRARAAG